MADRNSGAQERQGEEKREAGSTCRPHSGDKRKLLYGSRRGGGHFPHFDRWVER